MICISLGSLTFEECTKALGKSEFSEIRMDLLDFTEEQFKTIFSLKKKSIATLRPEKLNDSQRLESLKKAILAGAGYIDIEYEAEDVYRKELTEFAHKNNTQVIISYHDYNKTPELNALEYIIDTSFSWDADYVKLATMAVSEADSARIMGLYAKYKNLIAFCMGETGVITRVAAPLLGSPFTYAALNSNLALAPGQLTTEQLLDLYDILGKKKN